MSKINIEKLTPPSSPQDSNTSYIYSDGDDDGKLKQKFSDGTTYDLTAGDIQTGDTAHYAGVIGSSMPTITDNANGTVGVATCEATLYDNGYQTGAMETYTIAADAVIALSDNFVNYVCVDYNGGSPLYVNVTDKSLINTSDLVPVYTIFRNGTELRWITWENLGSGLPEKMLIGASKSLRLKRMSGMELTVDSGKHYLIASGTLMQALSNTVTMSAVDTNSVAGRLCTYSGASWSYPTTDIYSSTHYQGVAGLTALTTDKWTINWVYKSVATGTDSFIVLSTSEYDTQALAEAAIVPSNLPPAANYTAVLVGRIVVQEGELAPSNGVTGAFIDPAFRVNPTVGDHSALTNLELAAAAVTYGHIDDQAQTLAGVKTFSSFPVTPSSAPTTDYQVVNKKFVDDVVVDTIIDADSDTYVKVETTADEDKVDIFTGGTRRGWFDDNGFIVGTGTGGNARFGVRSDKAYIGVGRSQALYSLHMTNQKNIGEKDFSGDASTSTSVCVISAMYDDNDDYMGHLDLIAGQASTAAYGGARFALWTQPRTTGGVQKHLGIDENGNTVFNFSALDSDFTINALTSGVNLFVEASSGNIGIGTDSPTASMHIRAGTAAAGTAPIKLTSGVLLTTPEAGAIEFNGCSTYITNVATQRSIDRTSDVAVSTVTVENTTDETTLWTGVMPANSLCAGNLLKFHCDGIIENGGASGDDQITLRIKVGAATVATLAPVTKDIPTGSHWHIDANATQRTIGASGSRAVHIDLDIDGTTETVIAVAAIDTTASMNVTVTAEWATAATDNIISLYQAYMEYKN